MTWPHITAAALALTVAIGHVTAAALGNPTSAGHGVLLLVIAALVVVG